MPSPGQGGHFDLESEFLEGPHVVANAEMTGLSLERASSWGLFSKLAPQGMRL